MWVAIIISHTVKLPGGWFTVAGSAPFVIQCDPTGLGCSGEGKVKATRIRRAEKEEEEKKKGDDEEGQDGEEEEEEEEEEDWLTTLLYISFVDCWIFVLVDFKICIE